jgi:pSer/pThr/pTyr-binding forkhead associated (FHA) protein
MPKLHILSPGSLATTIGLTEKLITIGRTAENTIRIQDTNVSSRHAILVRDGDDYQLHDFKSTNGTFVNGEPIMAVKLKDGTSIRFGSVELRYESGLAKAATPGLKQVDQEMIRTPNRGPGSKERAGMAKRTKPEYAAGALQAGPVTFQPLFTANPIPPPPPKKSDQEPHT